MADKSQELALALLKEAKEKGILDPSIEKELAGLIGTEERPKVKEVLEAEKGKPAEKRELSPEQADQLLAALRTRFELPENEELRKTVDFAVVEKSLRASPEKLYALQKLEETGGEPQMVGVEGGEFIFEDRCTESPSGRRDLNFDQSLAQAEEFGVDMQSPDAYMAMKKTGRFDMESWTWLKTDPEFRERTGYVMFGGRDEGDVYVREYYAERHGPNYGWRASLRVKKA